LIGKKLKNYLFRLRSFWLVNNFLFSFFPFSSLLQNKKTNYSIVINTQNKKRVGIIPNVRTKSSNSQNHKPIYYKLYITNQIFLYTHSKIHTTNHIIQNTYNNIHIPVYTSGYVLTHKPHNNRKPLFKAILSHYRGLYLTLNTEAQQKNRIQITPFKAVFVFVINFSRRYSVENLNKVFISNLRKIYILNPTNR
jgi:hypothetical protein